MNLMIGGTRQAQTRGIYCSVSAGFSIHYNDCTWKLLVSRLKAKIALGSKSSKFLKGHITSRDCSGEQVGIYDVTLLPVRNLHLVLLNLLLKIAVTSGARYGKIRFPSTGIGKNLRIKRKRNNKYLSPNTILNDYFLERLPRYLCIGVSSSA